MKRFAFIFITLIIAVLLWAGIWFFASSAIKREIGNLATPSDLNQPTITCEQISTSGFPFSMQVDCKNLTLKNADANFTLANLNAKIAFAYPIKIDVNTQSPLHYSNAFFASEQELRFKSFDLEILLNGLKLNKIALTAEQIQYIDLLLGEDQLAKIDNFSAHIFANKNKKNSLTSFDIIIKSDEADIAIVNIEQARFIFEAQIFGIENNIIKFTDPNILKKWQQADGRFDIIRFEGDDKKSKFEIEGNFSLAPTGHINGKFTLQSNGIIEQFSQNIDPKMQPIFFGTKSSDGSYQQNIKIKNGTVYSGILPLTKLAPLF